MKKLIFILLLAINLPILTQANELEWPREIENGKYIITLYQPQLETLTGNNLDGRMAISIKKSNDDMIFGACWFTVTLDTDKTNRTAVLENLDITKIKFPDIKDKRNIKKLKEAIETDIESADLVMSLDKIIASLEKLDEDKMDAEELNHKAPDIYYKTEPTVLVTIDGKPITKEVEKSDLKYVVNTAFFIVQKGNNYYIKGENHWYQSDKADSEGWTPTTTVPNDIKKLADERFSKEKENTDEFSKNPPKIVVVTKPSELIVTDGKMEYEPIKGTELLYVTNTESDIIMDINSQMHYVLINGRWYATKSMADAKWEFVDPDKLPKEFASIPAEGSSISSVRVSVPGTEESKEAMYDQYIPQTAKVDRKSATTTVEYDGKPEFEKVEGTKMEYAKNTASTVLKIDGTYYAVDDGVWFESSKAEGPWKVSDKRPDEVDDIPANSPVYNVKYVYIYDSTPDVVYVGYTPGYYHSYMYNGVVVYGTGYYYQPWYGYYYYPRPVTYGFGVHYNPYTGWGFSVGISYGWMTLSYHSYGYWGPGGYAHGYRHGYYHGYHHGYHNGYRAGYARGRYDSHNAYRGGRRSLDGSSRQGRSGISTRNTAISNARQSGTAGNRVANRPNTSTKRNDHFADRDGNVFQRDQKGNWQEKKNKSNTRSRTSRNRTSTTPTRSTNYKQQLDRQYKSRSRGSSNFNSFNTNRSRTGMSRGGTRSRRF